jgi:hypothetical protein
MFYHQKRYVSFKFTSLLLLRSVSLLYFGHKYQKDTKPSEEGNKIVCHYVINTNTIFLSRQKSFSFSFHREFETISLPHARHKIKKN